jgi:hypothetical protein
VIGSQAYGVLLSSDQAGFIFHDVDRNADVSLKYTEVRAVKKGYGGYNSATGMHTDRKRALIVTVCVLGALGGLLAAVASARN